MSRSWQIEARFVPGSLEEAAELRRALIDNGEPPAAASGIVGWLLEKSIEGTDGFTATTKSRYRKALTRLALSGTMPRYSGVAQSVQAAA